VRPSVSGLLVTVLALGGAAAGGDPAGPEGLASVAEVARAADVVGIGEAHDNPAHHSLQSLLLERMADGGQRPVVALEMLAEDQQATLDQALAETTSAADLADRLQWHAHGWPDFAMYFPLFEAARRYRLPVLAADLNVEARRMISRRGLGALPAANRARVASQLPADAAREATLRRQLETVHCGGLPASATRSMAEEWHARNVTMARRIAAALADGQKVLLIAGRAHLAADAVPGQLAALRPGTRVLVIDLVERPYTTPLQNADLIITTTAVQRTDECAALRRRPTKWE
jgi:uncharacterized iron-regulated protein